MQTRCGPALLNPDLHMKLTNDPKVKLYLEAQSFDSQIILFQGLCGRTDCKRIEIALKTISSLRSCSCYNYQRVDTALPLIGCSYVQ